MDFWCGLCGFTISYERPDERFAYITQGTAHLILEECGVGRDWLTADLDRPFGRGINFQVSVTDLDPLLAVLRGAAWPLFMAPEVKWYRVNDGEEVGVRQFLVTDPDGYLVRFQSSMGRRAAAG